MGAPAAEAHFKRPGWFTKHVSNRLVGAFAKVGLSAGPDSSAEQLAAIAPSHPVFRITG